MHVEKVESHKQVDAFHKLQFDIYRNDKNWIAPLRDEIENIFNPDHNRFFADGDAVRFLLFDDDDNVVGRIAAFYRNKNLREKIKNGGIGFFECSDNHEAAIILFDIAKKWLVEKGCNTIDGPVNFGQRDRWWGLLVDGFDPPMFGMNYHPPYYKKLFESNGFQNYFEQYTFVLERDDELPQVISVLKERLKQNRAIEIRSAEKNNLKKYAEDFVKIYNASWDEHADVEPITEEQSMQLIDEVKPVMDPSLFIFAYVDGEPAGFFISIPDANQLLKYAKGSLNLRGKLNVLLHKPFVKMDHICGLIFGVVPQHRNKGLEGGMVAALQEIVKNSRYYTRIEMLWIGDFNKKMLNFVRHINAKKYRTFITYRKILDASIPFERYPEI